MSKVATSPLPSQGSPPLPSGGTKSEVGHLWAKWLRHPCHLEDLQRFRLGRQNQKGPTCGQNGYVTPAVSGIPTASKRGDKIKSGPLVGKVATSPLPSRGSPPLESGGGYLEVAHKGSKMLYSGSVRCAKQTLRTKKGGGFGYVKTLLLPKILANEERGGLCKTPHAVVLRRNAPPP